LQSKTHHRTNLCLVLTSPKSWTTILY
jgi:hypothetical protein